ncbi:hypothetical protein EVAR_89720_1 [Eumeta japonica]|uniref:Uncharacterized protein n=1 Tax=Eumeta variegata TaxID=151549 RepID=A0A4C1Y3C5_EUMVA|nr:hypothetical protein EVAR_89720_1 [Eumeta japonica]
MSSTYSGDASEHAYAAVAYWRAVRPDGTVHLALVAGKSRVTKQSHVDPAARTASGALLLSPSDEYPKEHRIATERRVLLVDPPGAYVRQVLYFIRRLRKQQQPFGADDVIDAETRLLRASQRRRSAMKCGPPPWG